jgi:sugar O-acyltransferase (sialic acid O-acetyltransferase NeuD family)
MGAKLPRVSGGVSEGEKIEIREPEAATSTPEPDVEMQRVDRDEEVRVAIVGAGGYGRVALDTLLASGLGDRVLGFYDDAHAALSGEVRGVPVLGDVDVLKSMLSVEPVHVVVAITDNGARLRVANSLRSLGARFLTTAHPDAYISEAAVVGDGCVVTAGVVVHPDAAVGSHCFLGPGVVVDRDAEVGAGTWISAGCVVGPGARVGARVIVGQNASVGRKAVVSSDAEVGALRHVDREGA